MFAIKILKQEVSLLNERIKILTKISYTNDIYANLEINDIKRLIKDLEKSISFLKEKQLLM